MTKSKLDAQTDLLLLECLTFGYNRDYTAWVVGRDRVPKPAPFGKLEPTIVAEVSVQLPKEAKGAVWLTSPSFEKELRTTYCDRALCDAGTEVAYRWTGGEFRVSRIWQRDDECCDAVDDYGTWPIVWPSSATCAYRWQVDGDAVTLVAITPKGEKAHRITGLPGPCETAGTVMSCAGFDVPVTSKDGDWIIWLSPSEPGADDVPILIVHAHVRRGCNL